MTKTTTVARINQVDILVIENGEKRVAIKPICQALGIDEEPQRKKLNSDPILSSVTSTREATGADGKTYEMVTIPFRYIFGWLFRIDSRNVKEEARETVLKYQVECYNALYNHFTSYAEFVEQKQKSIDAQLEIERDARKNFYNAKTVLKEAESALYKISKLTFDDYSTGERQLKLF